MGLPRSGTSLVEQVLASHPQVHGAGELHDLNRLFLDLPKITGQPSADPFAAWSATGPDTRACGRRDLISNVSRGRRRPVRSGSSTRCRITFGWSA